MSRTELIRIGLASIALIAAVVAYGMWYGTVMNASAEAGSLVSTITVDGARAARVAAAKTALASLASDESAVSRYFVSNATLVPFLESLQSYGTQLGAKMTINSVSSDTQAARPQLVVVGTAVGPFDAVMRVIGAIEYAPYYVTVDQLSLSSGSAASAPNSANAPASNGTWTATFTLTVGSQTPVSASTTPVAAPAIRNAGPANVAAPAGKPQITPVP
ncbi:MAG: hypothetical protein KGI41_02060 [Patescibacteria group bacterium]|nr:hypothetical protein [Patescibacteria group bacterium]MDE1966002.1 hypothetical protein [Patescibacteria group bacterium]